MYAKFIKFFGGKFLMGLDQIGFTRDKQFARIGNVIASAPRVVCVFVFLINLYDAIKLPRRCSVLPANTICAISPRAKRRFNVEIFA